MKFSNRVQKRKLPKVFQKNEIIKFFDLLSGMQEDDGGILYQFDFDKETCPDLEYVKETKEKNGAITPSALWIKVKKIYSTITPLGYVKQKNDLVKEIKSKVKNLTEEKFTPISTP